ncbi:hypothetical protein ACHAXR_004941 [Thalassiosira sp. AJA248-18]
MADQKKKLMNMISVTVDGLANLRIGTHSERFRPMIRHMNFKIAPPMYDTVGSALLDMLDKVLGDSWDDAHKEARALAYGVRFARQ